MATEALPFLFLLKEGSTTKQLKKFLSRNFCVSLGATYLERVNPSWWQTATQALLG